MKHSSLFLLAAALGLAAPADAKTPDGKPLVVFIAGKPSHAPGEHEHNAGVQLLAKCLAQGAPNVATKVHLDGQWPGAEVLAQADTVVIYADGGGGHPLGQENRLELLGKEMARGAGLVCLHYAVEPAFEKVGWPAPQMGPDGKPLKQAIPAERGSKGKGAAELREWLGGYFEQFWSVNPHWTADFKELPKHLISTGVKPFSTNDEWYYHMRFREGMKGVTPILSAIPGDETLKRGEGSHAGNPDVRRAVETKQPQHVAWAVERPDGGRGFGFTGGHFHKGWANDDQRKLVLNAIVWTAKADLPPTGVESKVTAEDLAANLDNKPPRKPPQASTAPVSEKKIAVYYGFVAAREGMSRFKAADGLEATLVAAEPMIQNPTNIDIDPRGRVWAVEAVNYRTTMRPWGLLREAGDRVVILEDTNSDGVSDKETTFYQNKELTAPLGILVLPQEIGTQVIVSAAPKVWLLTDADGDDQAEKAEVIFQVKGNWDHDHQVHAFVFGTDGKFYFNFGNESKDLLDGEGKFFTDLSGRRTAADRKPYQQGLVFRCDLVNGKPANIETLGWNFRNNYEVCVDSFGTMWQSDNDDDGNKAVRINYVMPGGNHGFSDEITGAAWQAPRTNIESEIPLRHWHQNDPGSVPNLLQTGAGSPTGILVNEGSALGAQFENQMIHCDAGPRTVRAYPVTPDGAGYKATMVDVLTSEDPWYRPADVAIAPDGSLIVADWYDAGVGGHNMADHEKGEIRGRLYRVAAKGGKQTAPKPDSSNAAGCIAALQSPNRATVYTAWQKLAKLGTEAEPELAKLWKDGANPRIRARALGLLARLPSKGVGYIKQGLSDPNSDLRITAIRLSATLAKTDQLDTAPLEADHALMAQLLRDPSPQVRREIALALYGAKDIAGIWTALAQQHDGKDRWYLEALGIGATGNEDACFDAWLAAVGNNWNTPAGRDIIWRVRATKAADYLAKIISDEKIAAAEKLRFFREFDFLSPSPQKSEALTQLATLGNAADEITREALTRLKGVDMSADPKLAAALKRTLDRAKGTAQFVALVRDFGAAGQGPALLDTALCIPGDPAAADAVRLLLKDPEADKILETAYAGPKAEAVINLLATTPPGVARLSALAGGAAQKPETRREAVKALARTQAGAQALIKLTKNGQLPPELLATAASALRLVQYASLQAEIDQLFPAPASLGGQSLPAISELVKIKGDIAAGRAVFERAEASCITCHKVNDKGSDFGPALSELGSKLPKEAIYEAIIYPNAGLSMGFETTQLATKDGGLGMGIVRSETRDEIVLVLPGGVTTKFAKGDIAKREKLTTSMMPSGLNQALSKDDLVNLVEYLVSLKKP